MLESESVERATQRVFAELRALESDMLHTLSEQTSAEKSSSKTAADIRALRVAAEVEELRIAGGHMLKVAELMQRQPSSAMPGPRLMQRVTAGGRCVSAQHQNKQTRRHCRRAATSASLCTAL